MVVILLLIKSIINLRTRCTRNLLAEGLHLFLVVEGLLKRCLLLILALVWLSNFLVVRVVVLDLELDNAFVDGRCSLVLPFDIDDLVLTGTFVCGGSRGLGHLWRQLTVWLWLTTAYCSFFTFAVELAEDAFVEDLLDIFEKCFCLELLINGTALLALPVLVVLLRVSFDLLLVLSHSIRYLDRRSLALSPDVTPIGVELEPNLICGHGSPIRILRRVNVGRRP